MPFTIPATNIGQQDNGCAVVTLLSSQAQQNIKALQIALSKQLSEALWLMPLPSLHSTLCEIIQPKPYSEDKAALFRTHQAEYEAAMSHVLSDYGPIQVNFNKLEVSQQAIVVMGDDGGVFNQIRAELLKYLPFPAETKLLPDVVHSSIARFTKEVDLSTVQDIVARHNVAFIETVAEFQLLYPIWPHLLRFEVVRRYPLIG